MNGLIAVTLRNPYAVTVFCLTLVMLGSVPVYMIRSTSCLYQSPAVRSSRFTRVCPRRALRRTSPTGWSVGSPGERDVPAGSRSINCDYFRSASTPPVPHSGQLAVHGGDPNLPPGRSRRLSCRST
jgi:hypothetical protein